MATKTTMSRGEKHWNKKMNSFFKENNNLMQYDQAINADDAINFKQLLGSSMLASNINPDGKIIASFLTKIDEAIANRLQYVYADFVIAWHKNLRYSLSALIPTIKASEASDSESINFKNSSNQKIDEFLGYFNQYMKKSLNEGYKVEVAPGIVVYQSSETKALKLIFNRNIISGK